MTDKIYLWYRLGGYLNGEYKNLNPFTRKLEFAKFKSFKNAIKSIEHKMKMSKAGTDQKADDE